MNGLSLTENEFPFSKRSISMKINILQLVGAGN